MIRGYFKKWQIDHNLSNKDVAEAMDISLSQYGNLMRSPFDIRLKNIMRLCDYVDLPSEEREHFLREVIKEWYETQSS